MMAKFLLVCLRDIGRDFPKKVHQKWKSKVQSFDLISVVYLTIILRMGIGYELAIIISYPTNLSAIIVLLRTPTNNRSILL